MPGPNGHKEIERSELPRGGVADGSGINNQTELTIYDLAKTFDENHVVVRNNATTTSTSNKSSFPGSTFNTNSTGTANKNDLFNGGVGKDGDNYKD